MVQAAGYEPIIIEYLKAGWTRPLLDDLLAIDAIVKKRPV